jgi:hypothetical protein
LPKSTETVAYLTRVGICGIIAKNSGSIRMGQRQKEIEYLNDLSYDIWVNVEAARACLKGGEVKKCKWWLNRIRDELLPDDVAERIGKGR